MKRYHQLIRHDGNDPLFRAVELSIAALIQGYPLHVHAEGMRGMGKTTIFRAAREMLPRMQRITGCPYNCDPRHPVCPLHSNLSPQAIAALGWEEIATPFLEISHAAKVGTVVGSIDLARLTATDHPAAALLPGTLAQANRGVVFVDEINRLADTAPELTDVLLDVMGTRPGRLQIEEAGLPVVSLPLQVTVWATSNPDEEPGPLSQIRRQLADRFDCVVNMGRPDEVAVVQSILQQDASAATSPLTDILTHQVDLPALGPDMERLLARLYVEFGLESLRALESLAMTARLCAALGQKKSVDVEHIAAVAPLVLSHRCDLSTINGILQFLAESHRQQEAGEAKLPAASASVSDRPAANNTDKLAATWRQWWQKIRERLTFRRAHTASQSLTPRGQTTAGRLTRRGGATATSAGEPVAPPRVARSLEDLPLDNYVTKGPGDGT